MFEGNVSLYMSVYKMLVVISSEAAVDITITHLLTYWAGGYHGGSLTAVRA